MRDSIAAGAGGPRPRDDDLFANAALPSPTHPASDRPERAKSWARPGAAVPNLGNAGSGATGLLVAQAGREFGRGGCYPLAIGTGAGNQRLIGPWGLDRFPIHSAIEPVISGAACPWRWSTLRGLRARAGTDRLPLTARQEPEPGHQVLLVALENTSFHLGAWAHAQLAHLNGPCGRTSGLGQLV